MLFIFQLDIKSEHHGRLIASVYSWLKIDNFRNLYADHFWVGNDIRVACRLTETTLQACMTMCERREAIQTKKKELKIILIYMWRNENGTKFPKRALSNFKNAKQQPGANAQRFFLSFLDHINLSRFFKKVEMRPNVRRITFSDWGLLVFSLMDVFNRYSLV